MSFSGGVNQRMLIPKSVAALGESDLYSTAAVAYEHNLNHGKNSILSLFSEIYGDFEATSAFRRHVDPSKSSMNGSKPKNPPLFTTRYFITSRPRFLP